MRLRVTYNGQTFDMYVADDTPECVMKDYNHAADKIEIIRESSQE